MGVNSGFEITNDALQLAGIPLPKIGDVISIGSKALHLYYYGKLLSKKALTHKDAADILYNLTKLGFTTLSKVALVASFGPVIITIGYFLDVGWTFTNMFSDYLQNKIKVLDVVNKIIAVR